MVACKVEFGVISGHSIIKADDTLYVWSPEKGLEDGQGVHLGMWLQMEVIRNFEKEDVHPFLNITAHINKEVRHARFLTYFSVPMDPEMSQGVRRSFANILEQTLIDYPDIFERVKKEVLLMAPMEGTDIILAPTKGKLGELYAAVFEKFGTTTSRIREPKKIVIDPALFPPAPHILPRDARLLHDIAMGRHPTTSGKN